ncbi:hypothetical protein AMECASPLE_011167, partial [Ameca splendens]
STREGIVCCVSVIPSSSTRVRQAGAGAGAAPQLPLWILQIRFKSRSPLHSLCLSTPPTSHTFWRNPLTRHACQPTSASAGYLSPDSSPSPTRFEAFCRF